AFRAWMDTGDVGVCVMLRSSLRIASFVVISVGCASTAAGAQPGSLHSGAAAHVAPPRAAPAPQVAVPRVAPQMSAPPVHMSPPHINVTPRMAPPQLAHPTGGPLPSPNIRRLPTVGAAAPPLHHRPDVSAFILGLPRRPRP